MNIEVQNTHVSMIWLLYIQTLTTIPTNITGYVPVITIQPKGHVQHEQKSDKSPVACGTSSENYVDAQVMYYM